MNLFYLASFIADLALGMALFCVPVYLIKTFDVSSMFLGIVAGLGSVAYTGGVIYFGRLLERFSKKRLLLIGCATFFLTYIIIPFLKTRHQVLWVYPLGSLGMAMFWPSIQTWLAETVEKSDLHKSISGFNISWSLGVMCGAFLGGFLFEYSPTLPFFGICFFIFLAALIMIKKPCMNKARLAGPDAEDSTDAQTSAKFIYIALMANFVSWAIVGTLRGIFPKLALEINFSPSKLGLLMFTLALVQSAMFYILGRTKRWHYKLMPLLFFQALAAVYLLAISFVSVHPAFFVIFIFLGASSGMTYFSSIYYSLYNSLGRSKRSGIHEAFLGAGAFIGPVFSGLLIHFFGLRSPYVALAILTVSIMILEIWVFRKKYEA